MTASADVIVVGGGIAGGALATVLARGGLDVVVLERQTVYRDKVRGEVFLPWGAAEARSLGLKQVLLDAGGGYATRLGRFEEWIPPDEAESQAIPLDRLLPRSARLPQRRPSPGVRGAGVCGRGGRRPRGSGRGRGDAGRP